MKYKLTHPNNPEYNGIYGGLQFKDGKATFDTDQMSYMPKSVGETVEEVLQIFEKQGFDIQPEKVAKPKELAAADKPAKPPKPPKTGKPAK